MRLGLIFRAARADWRERVRAFPFWAALLACVAFCVLIYRDTAQVRIGIHYGTWNSSWTAYTTAIIGEGLLAIFGFMLVRNAVARDRKCSVGVLSASSVIGTGDYLASKWLSNVAVLLSFSGVFLLATPLIQWHRAEGYPFQPVEMLIPYATLVLPAMTFIAALAVLWETVPLLRSGLGNIVYVLGMSIYLSQLDWARGPAMDLFGYGDFYRQARIAAEASGVHTSNGWLNVGQIDAPGIRQFVWHTMHWTATPLAHRLFWMAAAVAVLGLAAVFHRRVVVSGENPRQILPRLFRRQPRTAAISGEAAWTRTAPVALPQSTSQEASGLLPLLRAEWRLLRRGIPNWLLVVLGFLNLLSALLPELPHAGLLPVLWVLPTLSWSQLGTRDADPAVRSLLYSMPGMLRRQIPAQWCAGFLLALAVSAGVGLRSVLHGDWTYLLIWLAGATFIPSLALACGVLTRTTRTFEVVYALWWYAALNHIPGTDYMGFTPPGHAQAYLLLSAALTALALLKQASMVPPGWRALRA